MPRSNNGGFTLIEVLIASMILFLFLVMAAQSFSQAAQSSLKAERAVKVSALVPLLLENINGQIKQHTQQDDVMGQGVMFEVNYQWRAKLLQRKPPIARFDPSELEFKSYEPRFNLWAVELTVSLGTYQRQWQYEEISWFK